MFLRIGFNPTGPPHRVTNLHMHAVYNNTHNTCKNESKHSETGPVRQNPIHRTVSLFICVCIALCIIVAHNIAQNRPDSFPPYPPDDHHSSDDVYLREGGFKIARSQWHLDSVPHLTHGSLDPPEFIIQMVSGSRQRGRPTDHATRSVTICRIYVCSTAMWRNNSNCGKDRKD